MHNNTVDFELDPGDFGEEAALEFQKELDEMNATTGPSLEDDRWNGRGLGLDPEELEILRKEQAEEAAKLEESEEEKIERLRKVANPHFWED